MYPEFDYLHVGELGDATDRLIALLDASVARPGSRCRSKTEERLPLSDFPIPAYALIRGSAELPDRDVPVLQRLPLPLRVLRHPRRSMAGSRG